MLLSAIAVGATGHVRATHQDPRPQTHLLPVVTEAGHGHTNSFIGVVGRVYSFIGEGYLVSFWNLYEFRLIFSAWHV